MNEEKQESLVPEMPIPSVSVFVGGVTKFNPSDKDGCTLVATLKARCAVPTLSRIDRNDLMLAYAGHLLDECGGNPAEATYFVQEAFARQEMARGEVEAQV